MKYKVGDRVIVIANIRTSRDVSLRGKIATIVESDDDDCNTQPYLLEFDEYVEGHEGHCSSTLYRDGHCWWVGETHIELVQQHYFKDPVNQIVSIKGDNMEQITQIYEDRKLKKIYDKYETLIENRKLKDERYKLFRECVDTLDRLYSEDEIIQTTHYQDINLSESTLKDIDSLEKYRMEEKSKLMVLMQEVRAQLQMCETYEQKMNILKTYKIIRENGKVNA